MANLPELNASNYFTGNYSLFISLKAHTFGLPEMSIHLKQTVGRWLFAIVLLQMLNIALGYDNHYHTGKSGHRHKVDLKSDGIFTSTIHLLEDAVLFVCDNMMDSKIPEKNKTEDPTLLENIELCAIEHDLPELQSLNTLECFNFSSSEDNILNSYTELNSPPPKQST